MTTWQPDILGRGFEQLDLPLKEDDEGAASATLVRSLPPKQNLFQRFLKPPKPLEGAAVLYVHGWSDYFFQTELAAFWRDLGAEFYALDLRKYGRSLRDYQTPGYISDLATYDEEIAAAIEKIQGGEQKFLFLMGHSTGGLVLSLFADRHPDDFDALILNSPWLEFQLNELGRKMVRPLVDLGAVLIPHEATPSLDFGYYSRAVEEVQPADKPLNINLDWRPKSSFAVRAGWMKAILAAHNQIALGLSLTKPVCVLLSDHSELPTKWSDALKSADSVLNVEAVAVAALKISSNLVIRRVKGALHDIFLSAPEAKKHGFAALEDFALTTYLFQK